jgi:molybdenum cofactor cytidylyltransferase
MPEAAAEARRDGEGGVAGIVLAAGSSTRMGRNKLLLDLAGEPLVRRAVRAALAADLAPIVVVLGHQAQEVEAALAGLPYRPAFNADYAEAQRLSLQCGVRALPAAAAAAVVILADMPFVTAAMLRAVAGRYRETGAPLVVSEYGGVFAPPTLYDRSLFPEVLALAGEGCGRQVARRHRHEAAVVDWPAAALADLDYAADYERVAAELAV